MVAPAIPGAVAARVASAALDFGWMAFIYRRLSSLSSETRIRRGLLTWLPVGAIASGHEGCEAPQTGPGDGEIVIGEVEGSRSGTDPARDELDGRAAIKRSLRPECQELPGAR